MAKLYPSNKYEINFIEENGEYCHTSFKETNEDLKEFLRNNRLKYLLVRLNSVAIYEWSEKTNVMSDVYKIDNWFKNQMLGRC